MSDLLQKTEENEEFDDNGLARFAKPKTTIQVDQPNTVQSIQDNGNETVQQDEGENHENKSEHVAIDDENDEDQKTKETEQRVDNRSKVTTDLLDVNDGTHLSNSSGRKNSVAQEIEAFFVALSKSIKLPNFSLHLIFLISISVLFPGAAGTLVVAPKDVISLKGKEIRLPCSTQPSHFVYWERLLVEADEEQTIYYGKNGMVNIDGANGRFKIDSDPATGRYDLVIKDLQPMDAATYICIGDDGHGDKTRAQLVVLEYFSCDMPMPSDGFMGENTENLPEDKIQATCSLQYRGHVPPQIQWRLDNIQVNASHVSNGPTIKSVITLRGKKEMNGVQLSSLPTISKSEAIPWWTSAPLEVKYIHLELTEVVDCQAGSAMVPVCSPSCEYKLTKDPVEGLCHCLAVYNMGGVNYDIIFNKHPCHGWISGLNISIIVAVASVLSFAILLTVVIVLFVVRRKRSRKSENTVESTPTQESGSTSTTSIEVVEEQQDLLPETVNCKG